jgi:hypothetical protein
MKHVFFVVMGWLLPSLLLAQSKEREPIVKINTALSFYEMDIYGRPTSNIKLSSSKVGILRFAPSVMWMTKRKNFREWGLGNLAFKRSRNNVDFVDSVGTLIKIGGGLYRNYSVGINHAYHWNLNKRAENKPYFTVGIRNELWYQYTSYEPYALNAFPSRSQILQIFLEIVQRGGFQIKNRWFLEYGIGYTLGSCGLISQKIDHPNKTTVRAENIYLDFKTLQPFLKGTGSVSFAVGYKL